MTYWVRQVTVRRGLAFDGTIYRFKEEADGLGVLAAEVAPSGWGWGAQDMLATKVGRLRGWVQSGEIWKADDWLLGPAFRICGIQQK